MIRLLRYPLLVISCMLLLTTAFAEIFKGPPVAISNGSDIVVRWSTVDETGVQRFEILRRVGISGDFLVVAGIDQLKGGNATYEYIDKSVFKNTGGYYQYKIRVVNGQNPSPETAIVGVSHSSSAAKRTWGSIKAMFR